MKPAPFEYERPADIAGALALLGRTDVAVKILAGGQSLGPMLNLRLAQPELVVDITAIPELKRVEETADAIFIGACVTHADIEDRRVPDGTAGAMPRVAAAIAYRAVRNRGTIGGSIAHADPSADWLNCLAAMNADVLLRGPQGTRSVPVAGFVNGAFDVALQDGHLIEGVRVPRFSRAARWGYYKICRKTGEFAHAIGAVLFDPDKHVLRAVIGATEAAPVVVPDAAALFGGAPARPVTDIDPRKFDAQAVLRLLDDAGMSDAVDRQLHVVALRRAIDQACGA